MERFRKIVLFDIDYTLFNTGVFKQSNLRNFVLYSEVSGVLEDVSKRYVLGIFSEGDVDFQKEKLEKTGILNFFSKDNIHIARRKDELIEDMAESYKDRDLVVVDDKLPVLHQLKKVLPNLRTVWVKRGAYAEIQEEIEGFLPDKAMSNLSKLPQYIDLA